MWAFYIMPVYTVGELFLLYRLLSWLGKAAPVTKRKMIRIPLILAFLFCAYSMGIAFVLPVGGLQKVLKGLGNLWLAITLYAIMLDVLMLLVVLIIRKIKKIPGKEWKNSRAFVRAGAITLAGIIAVCTYGIINSRIIRETDYEITIRKDGGSLSELNLVLVSDLHMGYNVGCWQMQQMVDKINGMDADIVVIAGDIFDNEIEALDDPDRLAEILGSIKNRYGVYAVYGNHDCQEKILAGFTFPSDKKKMSDPGMDELVEKAGITLLRDEAVLIDDSFYLFGRADLERPGRDIDVRKNAEEIAASVDPDKPLIVLDHIPKEMDALSAAGVDLVLNGHTHDGQTYPLDIINDIKWENSYGYAVYGDMQQIVTSGVGIWGPAMRVGTIAEVCDVKITFAG